MNFKEKKKKVINLFILEKKKKRVKTPEKSDFYLVLI